MALDRADWHYGGDFPKGLTQENGGTHIGMFLAWVIVHELIGNLHHEESPQSISDVKERRMTGTEFLFKDCDEKFWEDDLSEEGLRFAKAYYSGPEGKGYGQYLDDYERTLAQDLPSIYHVSDTWESFDKLAPIISQRYERWKETGTIEP